MNPLHASKNDAITQSLIPALIKCFGIIFIGYIFGRFKILPENGRKGLGIFVQNLALPVLIFNLVATISFDSVNWAFVASVFVAKTLMFVAVAVIVMILIRPVHVGKAGLYAILATQSNDFALGYPLLVSLYEGTHSNYPSLLYLTAPVQVLLLNPPGFFMLEIYKQSQSNSPERRNPFFTIIRGTFSNPIVLMTVVGLIWNLSSNHTIPLVIAQLVNAISSAFPATALLLLGHSMAGKISTFKGYFVLTPVLLILVKNLVLPIVMQRIVLWFTEGANTQDVQDLSSLGFLYGAIPCAPAVFVFACQYGLSVDVVASTVIFSTLCSAPIMFVSATMATLSLHGFENVTAYMESTIGYISWISLICCLCLLALFVVGRSWHTVSYGATIYLVLAQIITSAGGILCIYRHTDNKGILYSHYILTSAGLLSTHMWTVFLTALLIVSLWKDTDFVLRAKYAITIAGFATSFGAAFLLTGSLLACETPTADGSPNFPLGRAQILLVAVITFVCLAMTIFGLISMHKCRKVAHSEGACENPSSTIQESTQITQVSGQLRNYGSLEGTEMHSGNSVEHSLSSGDDNNHRPCDQPAYENARSIQHEYVEKSTPNAESDGHAYGNCCTSGFVQKTEQSGMSRSDSEWNVIAEVNPEGSDRDRILRHIVVLLALSLSMLITFFVCLWKLFVEATNGIFVELEFLGIALNCGQGITYFLIFGLDSAVIKPFTKLWLRIQSWTASLSAQSSPTEGA